MIQTVRVSRVASYLCAIFTLVVIAGAASAQSTDVAHPTPISSFPVTGSLSSGTFYYAAIGEAGTASATLEFTPPDGGGSMSVSISGPECCTGDAYVGGTTGLPDPIREEARFTIPRRQIILVTVNVAVATKRSIRFSLTLGGTIGPAIVLPLDACPDLEMFEGFDLTVTKGTRTISGSIVNRSLNNFVSTFGRQWIEVRDIAKLGSVTRFDGNLVRRIPFGDVPSGGSLPYTATHRTESLLPPQYKVRIVYAPGNATDALTSNDDCNMSNNETLRYPVAAPLERL